MTQQSLVITQLGTLDDKVSQGAKFELNCNVSVEKSLIRELEESHEKLKAHTKFWGWATAGFTFGCGLLGVGSGILVGEPFIAMFGGVVGIMGGLGVPGCIYFNFREGRGVMAKAIEETEKLQEEGYVFAYDLKQANLVPSLIDDVRYIKTNLFMFYAIRPKERVYVPVISLSEIKENIGKPVIVTGTVSAAPKSEDMKITADADLDLSGRMMGIVPLSGHITGRIDGSVYSPLTQFRISDAGESRAVSVDYLAMSPDDPVPPCVLKRSNPEFGPESRFNARNQLVHFLDEALNTRERIMILGRPDGMGDIHAEAIALQKGKGEVHYLSVYQPKPQLIKGLG